MTTVLYVDRDDEAASAVADELADAGLEVLTPTATVEAAVSQVEDGHVDCLVTEYSLPDGTRFDLVEDEDILTDSGDFAAWGGHVEDEVGPAEGDVGAAPATLDDQRTLVDVAVKWLAANR